MVRFFFARTAQLFCVATIDSLAHLLLLLLLLLPPVVFCSLAPKCSLLDPRFHTRHIDINEDFMAEAASDATLAALRAENEASRLFCTHAQTHTCVCVYISRAGRLRSLAAHQSLKAKLATLSNLECPKNLADSSAALIEEGSMDLSVDEVRCSAPHAQPHTRLCGNLSVLSRAPTRR